MPCFSHLDINEKNKVAAYLEVKRCQGGDVVVRQGTPGQIFGLLVQGELKITAAGPNGAEIELCKQEPG